MQLGRLGIWIPWMLLTPERAQEIEQLGYGTVWLGGSPGDLTVVETLLAATDHLVVATGIVNVWLSDPRIVAASHHRITAAYPDRFLLGVGIGHPEADSDYRRPYETLVDYLDVLDAEGVPKDQRVLAALGPKVLQLSKDRAAGAHPYLVPPEHTRQAREQLGDGVVLAPEHKVVVESDRERARAIARPKVADPYLGLSNYTRNLKRLGWSNADLAGEGSDALIDALVGQGDAETAAQPLLDHLAAGADHVAVQLLTPKGIDPLEGYKRIAAAVLA